MNILCVGNSFAVDVSTYVHQIAKSNDLDINICVLYIGGCPIDLHWKNFLSKEKAYDFYKTELIEKEEIGKALALQKIHAYLFEGLYPFAGKIRTKTISKGGFTFANGDFLPQVLQDINRMPDNTFDEIVDKYIEMNIAHPFMEGNGRATRIWLDLLLKDRLKKCIDWSKIEKDDYLSAMKASPVDSKPIFSLLKKALINDMNNRDIFMKGIDCSYYYEEEE